MSEKIKSIEAGLYHLKLQGIGKETNEIKEKLGEVDKEMGSVKTDMGHNNELIEEEN